MITIPQLTNEQMARIERIKHAALTSRLHALRNMEANPLHVEILTKGNVHACSIRGIPGPTYNRVIGFGSADLVHLDEILSFYQDRNLTCCFEVSPHNASLELFAALTKHGYAQTSFHTTLYGLPTDHLPAPPSGIRVRKMKAEDFTAFGDIYVRAFHMPEAFASGVASNNRPVFDQPGWTFYMAFIEETPAAVGVLYQHDNVAYLAAAATHPDWQRRGCHIALHQQRMFDAYQNGCDLVVAEARFGSQSMLNMQRSHLQIATTPSVWSKI